jgi:SAUR family protein
VTVCVGGASRRFVVRAAHLNHPVFRELLWQAEEEYGFPSGGARAGPVALPCNEGLFERVLRHLSSSPSPSRFVTLEDIETGAALSGCCASSAVEVLPLLLHQGVAADKAVW